MDAVMGVLRAIGQALLGLLRRLFELVKSIFQKSGGSAIDTRKLISAVCKSADECRVVWPTIIRYPNAFQVSTSERTYRLLVGHEDEAVEQVGAALLKHVERKGGRLDKVHVTFLPDLTLPDDEFVVACSFVGKNQVAEYAGTATIRSGNVVVVSRADADTTGATAPAVTMSPGGTVPTGLTSRGGGRQRG